MKKIIALLMLLVSLASANAKCDWSKVKLVKSNTCNVYKFEVTGIPDTCFIANWFVWKKGTFGTQPPDSGRIYSHTFKDTGYYYVRVSMINACCKGDTTIVISFYVDCKPKCNWSSLKLQQWNNRNYYKWYVSGKALDDTCVDWMFMVYDFQTKKTDTVWDNRGICEVQFNVKGKYKMYLKVWDKCKKCDTTFYREVNIIQFPGAKVTSTPSTSNCKKYTFQMSVIKGSSVKDTCMDYYLMFYSGPWMAKMSQGEWDSLTDYQIGMEYDFPDDDFLFYTETMTASAEFKNAGRVLMIAQWYNKCIDQDTFMFRKLDVCKTTTKPRCNWSKLGFGYNNKCNTYVFELGSLDTCISYTTYIYNFKTGRWVDTFKTRIFTKTFADTGKYKLYVIARNKCGGCDTAYYNWINVECQQTSGIETIIKSEPKLIRMYDMLGRPVHNARENEITIYLYSDGSTRKVIKK